MYRVLTIGVLPLVIGLAVVNLLTAQSPETEFKMLEEHHPIWLSGPTRIAPVTTQQKVGKAIEQVDFEQVLDAIAEEVPPTQAATKTKQPLLLEPVVISEVREHSAPSEQNAISEYSMPIEQNVVSEHSAPIEQSVVSKDSMPIEQSVVSKDSMPIEQSVVSKDSMPIEQSVVSEHFAPIEQSVVSKDSMPIEQSVVSKDSMPIEQSVVSELFAPIKQDLIPAELASHRVYTESIAEMSPCACETQTPCQCEPAPSCECGNATRCQCKQKSGAKCFSGIKNWWHSTEIYHQHVQNLGQPGLFCERPFGTCNELFAAAMIMEGKADQAILHHYDFVHHADGTIELNERGHRELERIAHLTNQFPVNLIIESTGQAEQDQARRFVVVNAINQLGLPISTENIVLGPDRTIGLAGDDSVAIHAIRISEVLSGAARTRVYSDSAGATIIPLIKPSSDR